MDDYDSLIELLLRRMINLEELNLSLYIWTRRLKCMDGIELHNRFLIHLEQLKKFTFDIITFVDRFAKTTDLQSDEDIQASFIGKRYQQVAPYVCAYSRKSDGCYRIYSLPYDFDRFLDLDNSFPGGIFHKVRYLSMENIHPLEYKFITLVSQSFPLLQFLYVDNRHPQQEEKDPSTLITFPYLTHLHLKWSHDHYSQLFLLKENAHLPRLTSLRVTLRSLTAITNKFTADPKQFNFGTVRSLHLGIVNLHPDNVQRYFPLI